MSPFPKIFDILKELMERYIQCFILMPSQPLYCTTSKCTCGFIYWIIMNIINKYKYYKYILSLSLTLSVSLSLSLYLSVSLSLPFSRVVLFFTTLLYPVTPLVVVKTLQKHVPTSRQPSPHHQPAFLPVPHSLQLILSFRLSVRRSTKLIQTVIS